MKKTAVQVVTINDKGEILMVSRKHDHNDFSLPGGKVEMSDASLIMAAVREVKEETGIDIYNLELIFAMNQKGRMGYTYLADYSGEINYDKEAEPHVVKWGNFQEVIDGCFGQYNELVYRSLISKGVKIDLL
jgi:ADP-ribose pyrophosphatase YjhB (NUDIX family)